MRLPLKQLAKRSLAYALYYSGVLWLIAGIRMRHRVIALMYHRVLPAGADTFSDPSIIVSPEVFARHLAFLRRHFRPVSAAELADSLEHGRPLPSRGCLVTFDDGWRDNVEHALPILERERVPAIVFVATRFLGTEDCFWQERLARRMARAMQFEGPPRLLVTRQLGEGASALTAPRLRECIRSFVSRMKAWPAHEIDSYERELAAALQDAGHESCDGGDDRFMDWRQVATLAVRSRTDIGSHGRSHRPLTYLPVDALREELGGARADIEASLSRKVMAIAYPNGDYDDTVVVAARGAGYRLGFTTRRGLIGAQDDALRLRRINIHEAAARTIPEFLCIVLGVFHRWPKQV